MTKTTKIILLSTGGLILGIGAFLGVRYIIRTRKKKRQEEQAKLLASMSSTPIPSSTGSSTVPSSTGTSTGSGTGTSTPPTGTGTAITRPPAGIESTQQNTGSGSTTVVTSSGVPVVMASYTTLDPTASATPTYNPNSTSFQRLDKKLKSLYYILAPVDKKDGKIVYVETADFKPEKPNSEVSTVMLQTLWREAYNNLLDVARGFNAEEKDSPTKSYGNVLIDTYKKYRLDYLFPPKTADGKDTMFNTSAQWYKDAEKKAIDKNLKTDFWKIS